MNRITTTNYEEYKRIDGIMLFVFLTSFVLSFLSLLFTFTSEDTLLTLFFLNLTWGFGLLAYIIIQKKIKYIYKTY